MSKLIDALNPLWSEVAKLRAENERLKAENARLRKVMAAAAEVVMAVSREPSSEGPTTLEQIHAEGIIDLHGKDSADAIGEIRHAPAAAKEKP
jgi:regulator of replication initiation timing